MRVIADRIFAITPDPEVAFARLSQTRLGLFEHKTVLQVVLDGRGEDLLRVLNVLGCGLFED